MNPELVRPSRQSARLSSLSIVPQAAAGFKASLAAAHRNFRIKTVQPVRCNTQNNADKAHFFAQMQHIAGLLGITDVLSKFPAQMSGGQKQRVAAARSLISDPDIILADEPTGALDTKAARLLMEKLYEINHGRGRTILMVTHDPNAASFCSRILFIQDGVIFHELRRKIPTETREEFYARILQVMAQMGGGSANVL